MTRLSLVTVCLPLLALAANLHGADPLGTEHETAAALVRQLGDLSFESREKASVALVKMGRPAKQALLDGQKSADPEVRVRCEKILIVVLDLDFKARVDAFLADKEGKQEHQLAGWKRYRKLVGEDQAARELFVDMLKSNGELMEDAEARPKQAGDRAAYRCQYLMQSLYSGVPGRQQLTLGDVATMLFVASDPDVTVPMQTRQLMCNFLYQQVFRQALTNGPRSPHVRKLLGAWMTQAAGTQMAQQVLSLSMQLEVKEGMDLALKLIKDKDYANGMAITAVGKWGGKDQLALLEPLLDDKTLLGNFQINNIQGTTEIRDVALAMMVRMSGQQAKEYGFAFVNWHNEQQIFYIPTWMGFPDQAKRDAAFKKYKDWQAAQKK
ncbi:MAG: hypothetical protein K2R98_30960 [Gemmataceae bacterium]|nr:hypothetical protein [Gemmataceae bacterium]